MKLSSAAQFLQQSDIRAVTQLVNKYNGINLGQGICDQPTPEPIREGAVEAIRANKSIYSHFSGIAPLKTALLHKFQTFNRLPIRSEAELMVTNGSSGAFVAVMHALLQPGDEVILFEPFYGYHVNLLKLFGIEIRTVRLHAPDWQFSTSELEAQISDKTKFILITTPNNPCGKVFTKEELSYFIRLAEQHDLVLVTDEVYEYMTYDGHQHLSVASLPEGWQRTITMTSFSKTFNMTGWRLGAAAGPTEVIEKMGLISDLLYICPPTPLQYGLAAGFTMDERYYQDLGEEYATKRKMLCSALEDAGFDVPWPEGAYYIFADFEQLSGKRAGFEDDKQAVETLIKEAGVAAVPGRSFFMNPVEGKYKLRFCFAKEIPVLAQACTNLRRFAGLE